METSHKNFVSCIGAFFLAIGMLTGCVTSKESPKQKVYDDFASQRSDFEVLSARPDKRTAFNLSESGSFAYTEHLNYRINLNPDKSILVDAYTPTSNGLSPVIILAHGNNSAKEAHTGQAEHLASWGFHVVVVQLEKRDRWIANGNTINELASLLNLYPAIISDKIDKSKIILAGHSFGGSAVIIASSLGAPACGIILLDPAVVSKEVKSMIGKVRVPVMLLGADPMVFKSRQRKVFFKGVRGEAGEFSIKGATHDDAQFPSMYSLHAFGADPFTSGPQRRLFIKAITATSLSIAIAGNLNWAWKNLAADIQRGDIINPQKKSKASFSPPSL